MNSLSQLLKKNLYIVAATIISLGSILPGIIMPLQAAAAPGMVTTRSVQLSDGSPSATSVTYQIKFTTASAGVLQSVAIDFCDESPIIGSSTCSKPSGMTVGSSSLSTTNLPTGQGSWSASVINSAHTLLISNTANTTSVGASANITISTAGFVNPSTANHTFYARILTYTTNNTGYTSGSVGTPVDQGGVAMSTSDTIGVSATVQEQLTFCVSASSSIGTGCSTNVTTPSVTLGSGTPPILGTSVSSSNVYFQVTTNAQGTTNVNLKGTSGNLVSGTNNIPAKGATSGTLTSGTNGQFGARIGTITGTGTFTASSPYDGAASNYAMETGGSGVDSTYGDTVASGTGVLADKLAPLEFAAVAGSATPAGVYTAQFSLIATSSY
jgi:hypothetical protein